MTAQGGVRQDFLHVRAYNIMHTLTYTSDFNFVTPCLYQIYPPRTRETLKHKRIRLMVSKGFSSENLLFCCSVEISSLFIH